MGYALLRLIMFIIIVIMIGAFVADYMFDKPKVH